VKSGLTTNEKIKKGNLLGNIEFFIYSRNQSIKKVTIMTDEEYEVYRMTQINEERRSRGEEPISVEQEKEQEEQQKK